MPCRATTGRWLLWGVLFLVVNWFGDSLDGTVARFRNRQRPRYGFYVDHVIDAVGSTILMTGLALSGYMTPLIAMALLITFLLLSIEVYLATYTIGSFHLSFFNLGPTEIRIILAIGNIALYVRGPWARIAGHTFLVFDVGAVIALSGTGRHVSLRRHQAHRAALSRRAPAVLGRVFWRGPSIFNRMSGDAVRNSTKEVVREATASDMPEIVFVHQSCVRCGTLF